VVVVVVVVVVGVVVRPLMIVIDDHLAASGQRAVAFSDITALSPSLKLPEISQAPWFLW